MSNYLPLDAWQLIKRLARRHDPKTIGPVLIFFFLYALIARLRTGRTGDSILLSAVMTSILIFVGTCLYILVTHPGYRFF